MAGSPAGTGVREPTMGGMNCGAGLARTPSRKELHLGRARHGAVPQGALNKPGLALVVLVHEAGVHAQVRLPVHGLVPEGALQDHAGGPLEVRLFLVGHVPPPLLLQLQDALGLVERCKLLFAADHLKECGSVFNKKSTISLVKHYGERTSRG